MVNGSLNIFGRKFFTLNSTGRKLYNLNIIGRIITEEIGLADVIALTPASVSVVGQTISIPQFDTIQLSPVTVSVVGQVISVIEGTAVADVIQVTPATISVVGQIVNIVEGSNDLLVDVSAWYEGEDVTDTHVNSYDLTEVGSPTYTAGKVGDALTYSGSSNHRLSVGVGHDLVMGNNDFHVSLWLKFAVGDLGSQITFVGLSNQDWTINKQTNDRFRFQIATDIGAFNATPALVAEEDVWYHLIAKFDKTAAEIVLEIVGEETKTTSTGLGIPNDRSSNFDVGAHSAASRMEGQLDEIVVRKGSHWNATSLSTLDNSGAGSGYPT